MLFGVSSATVNQSFDQIFIKSSQIFSLQMTVEPPQGLKANMLRSFGSGGTGTITEKKFEYKEAGPDWQKLLFGLCLFNSVIHERKKYGRLGWNVLYEFNDSDLSVRIYCLIHVVSLFFNTTAQTPPKNKNLNQIFYAKLKKKNNAVKDLFLYFF